MSKNTYYITTAIPYVNGRAHVGHALEFVQSDILARHHRALGKNVRFLSGTDDHALKNAQAARDAGVPTAEFVEANAALFEELRLPLKLSYDDFIQTSIDPRHRPAVETLWEACSDAGDLYVDEYDGLYCAGCEGFVTVDDLVDGLCAEHKREPEHLVERNWFFRLSRYHKQIEELIEGDVVTIEPPHRRNEVLSFVRSGLRDFSVSRSHERAFDWGIPVPNDADQVIYVWFDALTNYISAAGYGTDNDTFQHWWTHSDERVHVIGKGIIRFHAVYWLAILLSAKLQLPTTIFVHDYLTVEGEKIAKSLGNTVDPIDVVEQYGADAFRWWLIRDVPKVGDADFRESLLVSRANELADGLGNLVSRTVSLVSKHLASHNFSHHDVVDATLAQAVTNLNANIAQALSQYDFRRAADHLWELVQDANRYIEQQKPWQLARAGKDEKLAAVLGDALASCTAIAEQLHTFLPGAAQRIATCLESCDANAARTLFPKFDGAR